MRPISGLALVLCGCILLTAGCMKLNLFKRAESASEDGPCAGMVAPDIEGEDFEGKHVKLSDYRGKVVVVAYWASGCRPCKAMIPYERSVAEHYRDKPFAMLGVNLDDNPEDARKVIQAEGITWPCCQAAHCRRWRVNYIPAVYVLDANGVVRHARVAGPDLDRVVQSLLAEAETKRPG